MDRQDLLAEQFEAHRPHLRAVAYRMLGTHGEADDAVQEAWLRLARADAGEIANLGGWLTTVVGRVCLDMLRARRTRREEPLDLHQPTIGSDAAAADPAGEAELADSVGLALVVVLDTLTPAERLAFVLHDLFGVPFDEIAVILDRSVGAAKQLASRARRRVRGTTPDADPRRGREIVGAFLAASREGNFDALLTLLDPDVVLRADQVAVQAAASARSRGAPALAALVRGADQVADAFSGRARAARPVLVDGAPGAAWFQDGRARAVFRFAIAGGRIAAIDLVGDPQRIAELDVEPLES